MEVYRRNHSSMHKFFSSRFKYLYNIETLLNFAGSKRGCKTRIIAISLLVSYKERTVVFVPIVFFICYLNGLAPVMCGEQGTLLECLSDPSWMLITYCTKAITGVRLTIWTNLTPISSKICLLPAPQLLINFCWTWASPPAQHVFYSFLNHASCKVDTFKMYSVPLNTALK